MCTQTLMGAYTCKHAYTHSYAYTYTTNITYMEMNKKYARLIY